jgi:two-component system sensor histidine kinase KdpD
MKNLREPSGIDPLWRESMASGTPKEPTQPQIAGRPRKPRLYGLFISSLCFPHIFLHILGLLRQFERIVTTSGTRNAAPAGQRNTGFRAIVAQWRLLGACLVLGAVSVAGFALHLTLTVASFVDLLIVFGVALICGFWQASVVSLLAVASLDFLFTQPLFHFTITDQRDWISLATFETASLLISRLSARERRSSTEATIHRTGMEQLYELSRNSLLLDLRQPPGPQLVVLIQRIFTAQAVALFDVNSGQEYTAGSWPDGEKGIARESYVNGLSWDDPGSLTSGRVLLAGSEHVGALVMRGEANTLVVDALTALAAMAIDRCQSFAKEERAEYLRKSDQLRSAVMDALAHDFKTPLATVQAANSGILETGDLNASQAELVSIIDTEMTRMNAICTRLLQTAKLESGSLDVAADDVNLEALIAQVIANVDDETDRRRIRVTIEDAQMEIRGDRTLLEMIISQYVENARKYSLPGTPIGISVRRSNDEALFSIHNLGPTIPLEDRERIFDRFYRSPAHAESIPGTGIGLSVVRKAATAHHGHVWVVSDPNEGTTFYLSIPLDGGLNDFSRTRHR